MASVMWYLLPPPTPTSTVPLLLMSLFLMIWHIIWVMWALKKAQCLWRFSYCMSITSSVIVSLSCPCFIHKHHHFFPNSTSFFSSHPHQSLCPPRVSLVICLSSTDCAGIQWRAVLSPWLCCKYLHRCMSLAVGAHTKPWLVHFQMNGSKRL